MRPVGNPWTARRQPVDSPRDKYSKNSKVYETIGNEVRKNNISRSVGRGGWIQHTYVTHLLLSSPYYLIYHTTCVYPLVGNSNYRVSRSIDSIDSSIGGGYLVGTQPAVS